MMGFKRGVQCAELVATTRLIVEKATEWSTKLIVRHIDFARAYGSVSHVSVIRSMRRRGVPEAVIDSYIQEMRETTLEFGHGAWCTKGVAAIAGLRQGCDLSPMVFRWILEDSMAMLRPSWEERGFGIDLGDRSPLTYLCWADDAWTTARSASN